MFRPRLAVSTTLPSLFVSWLCPLQPMSQSPPNASISHLQNGPPPRVVITIQQVSTDTMLSPFPLLFPASSPQHSPARSSLSTWNLDCCPGAADTLGSPGPGSCPDSWSPGAWTPGVCQQARSRVPEAEWQGLGSRGLFVPLWRMAGVGSLRNRLKIVRATRTSRTHQCTPLCNNTNFVAAEISIFSP